MKVAARRFRQTKGCSAGEAPPQQFTPWEASLLQWVTEGSMNKQIAKQLGASIRNVEKLRESLVRQNIHLQSHGVNALCPLT